MSTASGVTCDGWKRRSRTWSRSLNDLEKKDFGIPDVVLCIGVSMRAPLGRRRAPVTMTVKQTTAKQTAVKQTAVSTDDDENNIDKIKLLWYYYYILIYSTADVESGPDGTDVEIPCFARIIPCFLKNREFHSTPLISFNKS